MGHKGGSFENKIQLEVNFCSKISSRLFIMYFNLTFKWVAKYWASFCKKVIKEYHVFLRLADTIIKQKNQNDCYDF